MNLPHRHKIIFDTDPGVDDAMALYYALAHPQIEVLGVTTTFGNVWVEQAAVNALYLLQLAGRDVPVTLGAGKPLHKAIEAPPAHIHGADGLGNLPSREPARRRPDPRSSAQFIVDMARAQPGQITLVAVGPLGNLALALQLEPVLPQLLREVVIMGGSVTEPGNVTPVAEANIWSDPHAADLVFTAGWKLAMVGLDVTHRLVLPGSLFHRIADRQRHPATDALRHAVDFYCGFYGGLYDHVAKGGGCFGHDVMALMVLTDPDLFGLEAGRVRVATEGLAAGQTIMNRREQIGYAPLDWGDAVPRTRVCLQVDAERAGALFERTLMRSWLS
jgi:inosine-uridine nucleoside N-ribohydrolase